jgi:SAM-dependent methyltransferase
MNSTLEYYARNAQDFFKSTCDKPMAEIYQDFLPLLPEKGHILDAGCGSGRDSRYFLSLGFSVDAFDASAEMAALATDYIGREVWYLSFDDIKGSKRYDGIWAAASLLHLPYTQLPKTLNQLSKALNDNGILYASFKYGENEYMKEGRHFTPLNEKKVQTLFEKLDTLHLLRVWLSDDVRHERRGEKWLNLLARNGINDNN